MSKDDYRLVRLPEVMTLVALGRSSVFKLVREGRFPAPVALTVRARGWRIAEVRAWIDQRQRLERRLAMKRQTIMEADTASPQMGSDRPRDSAEIGVTPELVIKTVRRLFDRYRHQLWRDAPPEWDEFLSVARRNPDEWNSWFDGILIGPRDDLSEFGADAEEIRAVLKVAEAVLCPPDESSS